MQDFLLFLPNFLLVEIQEVRVVVIKDLVLLDFTLIIVDLLLHPMHGRVIGLDQIIQPVYFFGLLV